MSHAKDITKQRFGALVVQQRLENSKHGKAVWQCVCDCGESVAVVAGNLIQGKTRSCGCIRRQVARVRSTIDGRRSHPLYSVWADMKRRCCTPNRRQYRWYGAKGVVVCARWLASFQDFVKDMGPRPVDGVGRPYDIDRIDPEGGYSPENCRWLAASDNRRRAQQTRWSHQPVPTLSIAKEAA